MLEIEIPKLETQPKQKENPLEEHVEMVPNNISNEPMKNGVKNLWEELRKTKKK